MFAYYTRVVKFIESYVCGLCKGNNIYWFVCLQIMQTIHILFNVIFADYTRVTIFLSYIADYARVVIFIESDVCGLYRGNDIYWVLCMQIKQG